MIVLDASALVAIADREPEALDFVRLLGAAECVISHINYVEVGVVLISRRRLLSRADVDEWLASLDVGLHAGEDLRPAALSAYLKYGRGFHEARLNLSDCFAYALAKQLDAPLLYKGNDFALTDVRSALQPT